MTARRSLILLLVAAGCGRSELDGAALFDSPGLGVGGASTSAASGTTSAGADGAGRGGGGAAEQSGGKTGIGGTVAGGAGAASGGSGAGRPGGGAGGAPPPRNDPTTIGDERPGSVECPTAGLTVIICQAPQRCCDGRCIAAAGQCEPALLAACDGDEDCPTPLHCCRPDKNSPSITCRNTCGQGTIRHLSCGSSCSDADGDHIPDGVDACIFTEFEDGKNPLPEDGCSDYDGDGVHDGIDKCPLGLEDGLPPRPNDGCPQGT